MKSENNSISQTTGNPISWQIFKRLAAVLFVAVLLLGVAVQPGQSQPQAPNPPLPMPSWTLETVDGPRYFTNMTDRSVAYKNVDTPCAAYGGDGLYFACFDKDADVWNVQVLDSSSDVGQFAALTFYTRVPSGVVDTFISYYDNANGKLKIAYTFMGAWQPLVTVPVPDWTDVNAPQLFPEDPVEASLVPITEDGAVRPDAGLQQFQAPEVSLLKETEPAFPIKTNEGYGKFTSIAANQFGIYISFYDDRDEFTFLEDPRCLKVNFPLNKCEYNLKVVFWDGATWHFDVVDDYADQGRVGLWSSLAVDNSGNLHLAYMSEKYDTLKYAFWNRSKNAWGDRVTVDGAYPSQVGPMCSVALDDSFVVGEKGVPYISYLDDDRRNLKIAKLIDLSENRWTIDTVDTGDNVGWYTSIAYDDDNNIHISYYNAGSGDLKYAKGKINDWTIKTINKGAGLFTSIALGADNKPGILHLSPSDDELLFTRYKTSTTWSTSVVDTGGDVGYASSLKISPLGFPHISYLDATMGNLKYATRLPDITTADPNDTIWSSYHPVYGPHMGIYNDLDLFGESPRVAAYDSDKGNLVYGKNPWEFEFVQKGNDSGQHVSLAVDSNGYPHFSYFDATNQNLVYGTWNVGTSDWYTTTLDTAGDVGQYTSIAVTKPNPGDPIPRPYISYYDGSNQNLKIAYVTPGLFWKVETVDGGADKVGMYSSIALDNLSRPHISYYAAESETDEFYRNPRYAWWDGAIWNIADIPDPDLADELGTYTSLVIDQADNTRHVCYFDTTQGALKYARYIGGWQFATVDNQGDTGYSCSIALSSAGKPAITYYDNTGSDLQIAYDWLAADWPAMPFMLYLPVID